MVISKSSCASEVRPCVVVDPGFRSVATTTVRAGVVAGRLVTAMRALVVPRLSESQPMQQASSSTYLGKGI